MVVTEIVDPLNGKTEWMFKDGEIPDNGTVRDLTVKELKDLGFRVKDDKCPVGLIYKDKTVGVFEFATKRFESIDAVKDWTSKNKAYTIGGKYGNHNDSYVIRIVELPNNFDYDYAEPFVKIYIGVDQFCYKNGRDHISREDKVKIVEDIISTIERFEKPLKITPDFFETLDATQTYISKVSQH
jgi:hypothetical protein